MSKPEPVVPESVERALESIDCRTCDKADREEEITGLDHVRRAIAAVILRAEAKVCWNYGRTAAHKELLAQADALEKEPADE